MLGLVAIICAYFAVSFASKAIKTSTIVRYPSLSIRGGARIDGLPVDESEEEEMDEAFVPPDDEEESSPTANMQFMITNQMRYTLENELGYLSDEVDEMEPQIAAVVISRSLARPAKGMPASWRRPDPSRINPIEVIGTFMRAVSKQFKTAAGMSTKVVVPVVAVAAVVLLGRQVSKVRIRFSLPRMPRINLSFLTPKKQVAKRPYHKEVKRKINLKYMEKLHSPSFFDATIIKSKALRRQRV